MNFKEMASNIGIEEEDFVELLGMMVEVSMTDIDNFTTELAAGNYSKAAMAAHSIKGAAGNLGLEGISSTAEELEKAAKRSDKSRMPDNIALLKQELNLIVESLKQARP